MAEIISSVILTRNVLSYAVFAGLGMLMRPGHRLAVQWNASMIAEAGQ
jgi:hypothetical protein